MLLDLQQSLSGFIVEGHGKSFTLKTSMQCNGALRLVCSYSSPGLRWWTTQRSAAGTERIRSPRVTFSFSLPFSRVPRHSDELRISSVFTAGPHEVLGQLRRGCSSSKVTKLAPHQPRQLKHLGSPAQKLNNALHHHYSFNLVLYTLIPL